MPKCIHRWVTLPPRPQTCPEPLGARLPLQRVDTSKHETEPALTASGAAILSSAKSSCRELLRPYISPAPDDEASTSHLQLPATPYTI